MYPDPRAEQIDYSKLFGVIFLSVLLASLSAAVIVKYWIQWETNMALQQAATEFMLKTEQISRDATIRAQENREQMRLNAIERERRQAELQREAKARASIQRENQKTCDYWRNAYSGEPTDRNRSMRDTACARAAQR